MKKIFLPILAFIFFLFLFGKTSSYAATCSQLLPGGQCIQSNLASECYKRASGASDCSGTTPICCQFSPTCTNPSSCTTVGSQANCCNGYVCQAGSISNGFVNTCAPSSSGSCSNGVNPSSCTTAGSQSNCCTGYVCQAGSSANGFVNTCATSSSGNCSASPPVNPSSCTTAGSQSNCCSGFTCKAGSSANGFVNTCQNVSTVCVGDTNPDSCTAVGSQSNCCSGYVCTAGTVNSGFKNSCQPSTGTEPDCNIKDGCNPDGTYKMQCNGTSCNTAIGTLSTNVGGFINSIFLKILGVIGGLAVLLIIISGYRIMGSQGNPEKLQQAREQLTAAIVGLLFVIFSLVILQVIGFDILKLPGFGA